MRPTRAHNFGTYFTTTQTSGRRGVFQVDELVQLFLRTLYTYAAQRKFLLHDFLVMPNHVHLIITPEEITIERAMQFVKGGYSHAVRETGRTTSEIWQKGFTDHRIRDLADYEYHRNYIRQNPVKGHLCTKPEEYLYSSANPRYKVDPIPQRLKPISIAAVRHG